MDVTFKIFLSVGRCFIQARVGSGRPYDHSSLCAGRSQRCRSAFLKLREARDELSEKFNTDLKELSMGMTMDLTEAIEAGSTMVRVGSALWK